MAMTEPKMVVSSEVAKRVSAMLLTRKTSRPSKLSSVSNASPIKRETIPVYDHEVQGVGDETAIELEMVIARLDRRVNVIVPTEDRIVGLFFSLFSKTGFESWENEIRRLRLEDRCWPR
jgi:hypothetical protein